MLEIDYTSKEYNALIRLCNASIHELKSPNFLPTYVYQILSGKRVNTPFEGNTKVAINSNFYSEEEPLIKLLIISSLDEYIRILGNNFRRVDNKKRLTFGKLVPKFAKEAIFFNPANLVDTYTIFFRNEAGKIMNLNDK